MKFRVIILLLVLVGCTTKNKTRYYPTYTKELEDTVRTLPLYYMAWGCACAEWVTKDDYRKYNGDTRFSDHALFIEPADEKIKLEDSVHVPGKTVEFTGRFYKEKGYPRNYEITEEEVQKARVFRYTSYRILKSDSLK